RTRIQTETKQLRTGNLSSRDDYTYVAKWHLRRIRSATGDEVNFSYEASNVAPVTYKSYSHVTLAYRDCNAAGGNCGSGSAAANSYYDNRYETTTIVKPEVTLKVSYIYSAAGSVRFYRELHDRRDAPGEKALDKVIVFDREDNPIKSFLFSYGYFGSANSSPDDVRLRLDQVTARARGCQATSTTFLYREHGSVSRMASNRDYWGYYNNNQNQSMLPFVEARYDSGDRTPGGLGDNCMLYKIQSGTGAYTELAYSPQVDGTGARVGGVRLERVTVHNGVNAVQNQVFTLNYNTFYPSSGTFSSNSSAPAVPIPRLHEWQEVRYSATAPGGWGGYGQQLDICNSNDDRIDRFLYRSSDPLGAIPTDYIHYQWVTIQQPNRSRVAYQFTTAADYPDTNSAQSVKVSADPYNENSGCYTSGGMLPPKYGGSCNGDPMAPHRAGNYLSLPQDQRPYGVVNSAAQKRGLVLRQVEVDSEGRLVSQVENQYSFQQVGLSPLRSLVVAKERQVFGYILYTYYYNARVYQHERSWIPLTRQTAVRYDQRRGNSGAIAAQTQVTDYEYRNFFVSKIKTYNPAGGDAQVVEYERVKDSSNPPAALVQAKSYASPLQQQTYRLDATNTKKGTIWTSYEYQPNPGNHVRLLR
ncbi:MAG TPA: hypothetical protein VF598_14355, partial [Hymenobacter sp.]